MVKWGKDGSGLRWVGVRLIRGGLLFVDQETYINEISSSNILQLRGIRAGRLAGILTVNNPHKYKQKLFTSVHCNLYAHISASPVQASIH